MRPLIRIAAVILILANKSVAQASLIAQDWQTDGDGLITFDSDTGLEWLDVTVTQGISYNQTLTFLSSGVGGAYDGWRLATLSDITNFWINAGIVPPFDHQVDNNNAVEPLIYLWGQTRGCITCGNPYVGTRAYYDAGPNLLTYAQLLHHLTPYDGTPQTSDYAQANEVRISDYDASDPEYGFALIREPISVPEPSTLALLSISLMSAGLMRRRKRT